MGRPMAARRLAAALACAAAAGAAAATPESVEALQRWAQQSGAATQKVKPALGPGLRGLVAEQDIAAGEPVLDVPFAMMMTLNTAQAGPLAPVLAEQRLTPTVIMALHLMNEKLNASSVHQPWLSALPTSFETPLSWSDEELHALNGSTVLSVIRRRKQAMREDYDSLFGTLFAQYPALFDEASYTWELFAWALSTVWSRAFVFNVDSQLVPVIVPFADLFEHGNVNSSFSLEDSERVFRVTVGAPVRAGDRVYISLGAKPNSQLLMNYGFVLPDNPYDTVLLNMFLNEDDPFYSAKSKILTANGQAQSQLHYLRFDSLPPNLLESLRVQLLKPSELDMYSDIFRGKRVSLENELDVLRQLIAACDTLLKMYPTTAIQDQALINDEAAFRALSDRAQTALILVFGEKRVLHRTVELVSHMWSLLLVEGWHP